MVCGTRVRCKNVDRITNARNKKIFFYDLTVSRLRPKLNYEHTATSLSATSPVHNACNGVRKYLFRPVIPAALLQFSGN